MKKRTKIFLTIIISFLTLTVCVESIIIYKGKQKIDEAKTLFSAYKIMTDQAMSLRKFLFEFQKAELELKIDTYNKMLEEANVKCDCYIETNPEKYLKDKENQKSL